MKKIVFRGLLAGFPFFVLLVYIFLIHMPQNDLQRVKSKLEKLGNPAPGSKEEQKRRKRIMGQREKLRELLSDFASPVKGEDRSSVGYRLSRMAKDAGLTVDSIQHGGNTGQSGWEILEFSMEMHGRWNELVRFVHSVRVRPKYLISISNLQITRPQTDQMGKQTNINASAKVTVLIGVPWESFEEAGEKKKTSAQDASGGSPSDKRTEGKKK